MSAGTLNRRLVLEEATRVSDGAGGYTEAWLPVGDLWGAIKSSAGRESLGGNVALSTVNYRVTVRAAPHGSPSRPRADQRFREKTRLLRILAVADSDADQHYLTCHCAEEVTG